MKIYGREDLTNQLSALAESNRLPHAILLKGEKGVGKKTISRYIAKLFLHDSKNIERIDTDTHPDVMFVKNIDGDNKYSANSLRKAVSQSAIKPNDGSIKVYIFDSCQQLSVLQQNLLLKLIEEPLPFLKFIFTADDVSTIIPTIISRVTIFPVNACDVATATIAIKEIGSVSQVEATTLAERFAGNIGLALDSLSDKAYQENLQKAKAMADALVLRNEYKMATILTNLSKREQVWGVLDVFGDIVREGMLISTGVKAQENATFDEAKRLSAEFSKRRLIDILDKLTQFSSNKDVNFYVPLMSAYFVSDIFEVSAK